MTATPLPPPEPALPPSVGPGSWAPPAGPPAPDSAAAAPPPSWVTRRELRAGLLVVGVLVVVGVLGGLVWLWWSPSRGIALALGPHTLLPDETEAFVAADGRFAVISVVVGALAGAACWLWRSVRGPLLAVALAVGCGAGAALTALVGRLFGGGVTGAVVAAGSQAPVVTPPLELRATGLLALEAAVALLVYGVSVTVSARDDLGVERDAAGVGTDPDGRDLRPPTGVGTEAPPAG